MKSIYLLLIAGILLASCSEKQDALNKKATVIGEDAAMQLIGTLKQQVQQAVKEGGPVHAIRFCNENAIPLTNKVQNELKEVMSIKRTSLKYRNPDNAPDELEQKILEAYEQQIQQKQEIQPYRLTVTGQGENRVFHYFKPMKIAALCTTCHGAKTDMNPELVAVLDEKYPQDKATGYQTGDFRGVVHVSIPENVVNPDISH